MRKLIIVSSILLLFMGACDKPVFEKPDTLISRKKMINMLVDVHLAESTFNSRRYQDSLLRKSKSEDFYYSVLKKYNCPDSVFEKSFVYYASEPKKFEKMYREVINRLNEMEQFYSAPKNESVSEQAKPE